MRATTPRRALCAGRSFAWRGPPAQQAATSTTSPRRWRRLARRRGATSTAVDCRGRGRSQHDAELEKLFDPGRAQRRARFHDHERPRPRRHRGHLPRRADRHADGRAAALTRMGAVVLNDIGPRARARGPVPHRRLRRTRAAPGRLEGSDRARHPDEPAAVHGRVAPGSGCKFAHA